MAEELIHGFIGGLNKDLATSLVQADSYIDANNIRIVTQEGQSSGILMNILGNQFSFSIPDVVVEDDIPDSTNLQIIGWTTIRDTIVLFTCPEVANGTGLIWTVTYDPITQTTTGPVLKYRQLLNFDSKHPIEAIGRYETTTIQRVYWTDNYNPPRSINLADPLVANTDIDIINMTSTSTLNIPILTQINGGGSLLAGSYQYTYRLKKTNGTYSVFAPLSNPINIVASSETTANFQDYQGSTKGTNTGKSVNYNITNTDDSYNTIEHVFIFKDTYNGFPQIFIFKEDNISVGIIPVTHSANSATNYVTLTLEELLISTQGDFQRVKTITTKDNMLFFGNTKSDSFKINLDTRAYRFDSTRVAQIKDIVQGNIFIPGVSPDFDIVTENHDAINPFNKELTDTANQYKYQTDGTTLGGEGKYIKYKFVTKGSIEDNVTSAAPIVPPFVNSDSVNLIQGVSYFSLDIPTQKYEQNNAFYNIKSPYYSSIYAGYARGEVYRFGIVFYDKSGRQSYTNWIGDIKFPEASESGYELSYVSGNKTYTRQLGIEFLVNIPSTIKSQIQGYSIVRLERTDPNKSRLGIGLLNRLNFDPTTAANPGNASQLYKFPTAGATIQKVATVMGGCINFDNYSYTSGDYLQDVSYLSGSGFINYDTGGSTASYDKLYTCTSPAVRTKNVINKYKKLAQSELVPSTFDPALENRNFINAFCAANSVNTVPSGLGDTKGLFCLKDTITQETSVDYKLVSINRDLSAQYGGDTYSSRGTNTYINCNNYFPISQANIVGYDIFTVFGGDTYVNYFDVPYFEYAYTGVQPSWATGVSTTKEALAFIFPTESPINIGLRQGDHFAKSRTLADLANRVFDTFTYNQVYSQQNNTRVFISKPFIDTTQEEFDSRIWYSKTKINGEQTDNWTFIDGYKDIESIYGPINKLTVLNDNLFAFQDKAVANILVNPLSIIQDNNASNLVLGKATGVIQKHIYLSTEIGCKHQWSVVKSDKTIYWFDILGKRLCNIESTTKGAVVLEMSDVKGLISYFQENLTGDVNNIVHNNSGGYLVGDSPTYQYGITAGYDYRNKEVVFTFLDTNKQFTLAFNEILTKFTSFYSFKPNLYIYTKDKFISADPESLNQVYLHNIDNTYGTFYGTSYDSDFSVITNKFPANTKVYDNLELFSEVTINNVDTGSSFNKVQCTTKYQDSGLITLTPSVSIKRRERSWRLFVPRDTYGATGSTFQARLRDKYLITKLVFTNSSNKKLLLHWLKVLFRASIS